MAPALLDSPRCEFVAVSRARAQLADEARALGARRWYPRWNDLVADADVRAVYIATPVHLHAEQTIAAAEAGRHVLCEKPMAMTAAECDRMIAACRANGVQLGIAYYRRFYKAVRRIKAVLEAGEIGQPVFAEMQALEWFDPDDNHPRGWLLTPSVAGGGPMMDFGCHRLEVLLSLFGPVVATAALSANVVFDRAVEDTASVLLRFAHGPMAAVTVTHASAEKRDTLHVYGTRGAIHADDLNAGELRIVVGDTVRIEQHPKHANVHRPLVDDFVEAVQANREPAVTGAMGRAVAEVEDRIYAVPPTGR